MVVTHELPTPNLVCVCVCVRNELDESSEDPNSCHTRTARLELCDELDDDFQLDESSTR